jgi:3',5'-cyclic AMP phosphodiesterase CpdA
MKIIHLSDLHIGYPGCEDSFRVVADNIISFCEKKHEYIIIITGDIVDKGNKKAQLLAAKSQIEILANAGFTVLIAPGNHDYGSGIFPRKKFGKRFNEFFYGDSNIDYPILGHPKDNNNLINDIAFIGIDSMEAEVEERDYTFGAEGRIGQDQLNELDELLKSEEVVNCKKRVVYLHHHPFKQRSNHGLHDVTEFKRILKTNGNVDCLLFGHNHKGLKWNGSWGIQRCYDAGTSTGKKGNQGHHRVIDLSKDPNFDFDGDFHQDMIA